MGRHADRRWRPNGTWWVAALMALVAGALARVGIARADGAFPDAQTILVPSAHPEEIVLATNFGVVLSEDGGVTWQWSCEVEANAYGIFYQQSPPPRRRLYAIASAGVVFSDDLTCSWSVAGGALSINSAVDLFVGRSGGGDHVLAVASACCDATGGVAFSVHASSDAGTTFGPALYTAPAGISVTGVESAEADPATIYLTLSQVGPATASALPLLARSVNGGGTFVVNDLSGQVGPGQLRIVSVDRRDPQRVLLLRTAGAAQALVITRDGGVTATAPVQPSGTIKGVLETNAGSILVATDDGGLPALFRSQDLGQTFQSVFNPPHVRGLAERGGTVYAATDNARDGHAIAVSSDEGTTWRALMAYGQVQSIVPCLKAACQAACATESFLGLWPPSVCAADGAPLPRTSGPGGAAGGAGVDDGSTGAAGATGRGGGEGGAERGEHGGDGAAVGAGGGPDPAGGAAGGAAGSPGAGASAPPGGCATAGSDPADAASAVGGALALALAFTGGCAVRAARRRHHGRAPHQS